MTGEIDARGSGRADDAAMPTPAEVRACVARAFCDVDAQMALAFSKRHEPERVLGGRMMRFPMRGPGGSGPVMLTVFANPGVLGRQLWMQEVRALLRLRGVGHPALPEILDGGIKEVSPESARVRELAFLLTAGGEGTLGEKDARAQMRGMPVTFVRRFFRLVDALVTLHRDGFLHRNIQPGAIEYTGLQDDDPDTTVQLRLGRFELSSLLADFIRRGVERDDAAAHAARMAFVNQGPAALANVAPERLSYLFRRELTANPEHVAGDVYSLGMVAFQCLVDELDPALLEAAFPATGAKSAERYEFDPTAWQRLHVWQLDRIAEAEQIGPTMREFLRMMLEAEFNHRPRSLELLEALTRSDVQILEELSPRAAAPTRLVAIEPRESGPLQEWGWVSQQSLSSRDGQKEVLAFVQEDLRDAWLEYAPGELTRHLRTSERKDELQKAKYVLRGELGFYYGHVYENRRPRRQLNDPMHYRHVFMIRWVLRRELVSIGNGRRGAPRIGLRVAPLKVVARADEEVEIADGGGYPFWDDALAAVHVEEHISHEREEFVGALRWMVRFQRAQLEARRYAFVRIDGPADVSGGPRARARLRYDSDRDARWLSRDAIRNLYALNEDRRPKFADFFTPDRVRDFDGVVRWRPDADGSPSVDDDPRERHFTGRIDSEGIEPDCVTILLDNPDAELPTRGWIEPADDEGQMTAFGRQAEAALVHLFDHPSLMAKLLKPASFMQEGDNWRAAAAGLEGQRTPFVLQRMLAADSIYVLHGPPGTGKTTVVSRAVRAALAHDPSLRVLVAAQSHHALDNLAIALCEALPTGALPVRIASEGTEMRVDARVSPLTRRELAARRPVEVMDRCRHYLATTSVSPQVRAVLDRWINTIPRAALDIVDRTYRGANVVFATCLQSIFAGDVVPGLPLPFDWVIVEEAAKALPSELVIPLLRGARWTLIGDHRQLDPYGLREMLAFLTECVAALSNDRGLAALLDGAEHYSKYLDLFARFFAEAAPAEPRPFKVGLELNPVDALNRQFRMAPDIGTLVADAFYNGAVENGRGNERPGATPLRPTIPKWFGGHRLVWLNTDDERFIMGDGHRSECEAFHVRRLIEELWNQNSPRAGELAILTPYRRQRDHLMDLLPAPFRPFVQTIDSFQGREADIVIVSLVRGYPRRAQNTIYQRIGHLADPRRVNVMLSRAREYLVLVGQLNHFHDAGRLARPDEPGAHWATICARFRDVGTIESSVQRYGTYITGRP